MNPFFIRNRLQDYIDEDLSPSERNDFERAIQDHPELQQELQDLQNQKRLLQQHGQNTAPDYLAEQILSKIDALPAPTQRAANNNLWFLVATAVASVTLFLIIPQNSNKTFQTQITVENAQIIPNDIILPKSQTVSEEPIVEDEPSRIENTKPPSTKPAKKKTKNLSGTFIIDSPYREDWEGEVIELKSHPDIDSNAYQIRLAEENILFALSDIAIAAGGQMNDNKGNRITPTPLTYERGFRQLNIIVPVDKAQGVDQKLRQLGAIFRHQSVSSQNGQAIFPVEVTYKFY